MTVTFTTIDFNELTRLISREVDGALQLSRLSKGWEGKLHISHIKIKLGRVSPPSSETHDGGSPVEGAGGEPHKPFLLLNHYPPAKQGWEFEMDFSAGTAPPQVRPIDGVWHVIPPEPLPTADLLFRTMPIQVMKGVSKWWAARLGHLGISTVGTLMSLEHRELIEISQKTRSRYPLELFAKAQLLRVVVPEIPISKADEYSLFELIGKSATDLRKLIGQKQILATASEHLYWLISMLQIAMAGRVLRQIFLKDLRKLHEIA
ncbi:MAG: hypothetical protein P8X68_19690 [Desulfobacterales bacterium]